VGGFLGQLHEKRIYHADLKPANVLVRERGDQDWEFILVDLDRVRFDRALTLKQRARNLAQLDSPFQFHLPRTDRLRAFRAYLEACPAEDERLLLRESLRETEKRRRNDQEIIQEQLERLNSGKTDFPRKL
jgi:tRNA A-37 threonylcarbamoyl transferase component Bud32